MNIKEKYVLEIRPIFKNAHVHQYIYLYKYIDPYIYI